MEQDVRDDSRFCQIPQSGKKALNLYSRPNRMLVAVSLTFILATAGLVYYWMLPPPPGDDGGDDFIPFGHGVIAIDGDADFAARALLEGWPGDGSLENPYLIDGLDIDRGGAAGHCISISNTRVSFIIRNCNFTRANLTDWPTDICVPGWTDLLLTSGAGILLLNVSNGELVNNTCNSNDMMGIYLLDSHLNTVANNTCFSNMFGILLWSSDSNTVANNTCSSNGPEDVPTPFFGGIFLSGDHNALAYNTCANNSIGISLSGAYNTVANNTCSSNLWSGIELGNSTSNTVANNTCNYNGMGIWLYMSTLNTVANNTCFSNRYGILDGSDSNTMANNTCFLNHIGIAIHGGNSNTVAHNMCNSNDIGILLDSGLVISHVINVTSWSESQYNTVANNICNNNEVGILLNGSSYNTVENNTCNSNDIGIFLDRKMELDWANNRTYWVDSHSNTVADNTCNYNRIGIYHYTLGNNTVVNNAYLGNTEHDIFEESATE